MKRKIRLIWHLGVVIIVLGILLYLLYEFNIIPHGRYTNADFRIADYYSMLDKDGDGIDDQTDILTGAKEYVATEPKYQSKYYEGGYPDDEYGVCTDVVGAALLHAGYDLRELVNADILANPQDYADEKPDIDIDFRRVRNLLIYFEHTAISLTTDTKQIAEWQGGDIVVFDGHIGIISDVRNADGVPFLIHHGSPLQLHYEEDVLENYDDILGHFRIS